MTTKPTEDADAAVRLAEKARPIFAGQPQEIVAGALADLVALWLAGNVIPGDPKKTERMREELLKDHVKVVRMLIPVNFALMIEHELRKRIQ